MLRTHTCGELRNEHISSTVTLSGWIQKIRNKGSIIWIDLRDRYGVTQLVIEATIAPAGLMQKVNSLAREYVIQITGKVKNRTSPNPNLLTGTIEVQVQHLNVLNPSQTPPFTIEPNTDGGEALRMQYRYLDLRRQPLQNNLLLRHRVMRALRTFLEQKNFLEIETPMLIKTTPEGARDFLVPSRMQPGACYALPQSPQTLKQLLMIAGFDRYYQLAKCFRDEDLRADRQPEFSQLDCELSFVTQADIRHTFEACLQEVFQKVSGITLPNFPVMTYREAIEQYGTDKPDTRLGMPFIDISSLAQTKTFLPFDQSEQVIGMNVAGQAHYTRKQLDQLGKLY